ncbi:unnamed protein product [Ilex paraguariensis]|uniref:PGG domain-containing protein n=1 Tax=Ilex paraguariensis TaxID=185542 RepID=A0ABC8V3X3_9AQUA
MSSPVDVEESPEISSVGDKFCGSAPLVVEIGILSETMDGFVCEEELIDYGNTPIHVAASNGDLENLRTLIETNKNECLRQDKHGGTPLHAAARRGRFEAMKVILEACPDAVKVLTVTRNNCLHTAVLYNQVGAVGFLVEWLGRNRDYAYLINGRDSDGKTPLHLAVSTKQIQTLKALLTCNEVDVNATTGGGFFTALDILSVLPYTGMIDVEIEMILRQAGALKMRVLANRGANSYAASFSTMAVLLMATLLVIITYRKAFTATGATFNDGVNVATRTYQAAFTAAGATFSEGGGALRKQESIITGLFLLFNGMAFVGSLAVAILVIHKLSARAA